MGLTNLLLTDHLLCPSWAIIVHAHWEPGIGDPSIIGWITVIVYFITALLCFGSAWQTFRLLPLYRLQHYYWLWLGLGLVLVFLGFNKQLDLQSWLTLFGKKLSLSQGWYLQRRYLQVVFISSIVFSLIFLFLRLRKLVGQDWKIFRLTFLGFLFLSGFILIRAVSFHHIDRLIGLNLAGIQVNWLLELGGLFCIAISCFNYLRQLQYLRLKFQENINDPFYSYEQ